MPACLEYTSEHHQFRQLVHGFVQHVVVPAHESLEREGGWDRSLFIEAGKVWLLGFSVPEHLGGPGVSDFRYNAIVIDELQRARRPRALPAPCKTTSCCLISPT